MKLIVFAATGLMFFALAVLWLQTKIQYRIGSRNLKILCLGIPLRRIPLTDIKRISKRAPSRAAERWFNTLHPTHRILAIQRYRGLRKFVLITPRNRYVFMHDLQNSIKRVKPDANVESLVDPSEEPSADTISQAEPAQQPS